MATISKRGAVVESTETRETYALCLLSDYELINEAVYRNTPGLYEIPEQPYFPPASLDLSKF